MITADAMRAQRAYAAYLVEQRRAHYLFTIKDNQPILATQLRRPPWKHGPVLHRQPDEAAPTSTPPPPHPALSMGNILRSLASNSWGGRRRQMLRTARASVRCGLPIGLLMIRCQSPFTFIAICVTV
ncbi:hypothetical protein ACH4T9_29675 [Micromonospora sp. NPDC020750]|uniref:hypothetical protein n=1 Tax=unclassified Micromonospora TaxID=2617518 RepID=UPI0037A1204C